MTALTQTVAEAVVPDLLQRIAEQEREIEDLRRKLAAPPY